MMKLFAFLFVMFISVQMLAQEARPMLRVGAAIEEVEEKLPEPQCFRPRILFITQCRNVPIRYTNSDWLWILENVKFSYVGQSSQYGDFGYVLESTPITWARYGYPDLQNYYFYKSSFYNLYFL